MLMPAGSSRPVRSNSEEAPVAVAATCSRYWPGAVCTADATRPLPRALIAETTSESVPEPTSTGVVVPSDCVRVRGALAMIVLGEAIVPAETRACAAARSVTSKVSEPAEVPVADAVTELELEVTVVPAQVEVFASEEARLPTVPRAVDSLPSASAAFCWLVCWVRRSVCWFPCTVTSWLMIELVSRLEMAPEMVTWDTAGLLAKADDGRAWLGRTGRRRGGWAAPPPRVYSGLRSLQQHEHRLRGLVGLREHGGAGLREDLVLRELDHLRRHVRVTDPALGRRHVLDGDVEVVDRVLEPVLERTQVRARRGDTLDGGVERGDRVLGRGRGGEVERAGVDGQTGRGEAGQGRARAEDVAGRLREVDRDAVVRRVGRTDLEDTDVAVVRAVEELGVAERRGVGDPVELALQLLELGVRGGLGGRVLRAAVRRLHRQVAHALQDRLRLVERAFRRLDDADAVLRVADGDLEAADLRAQPLGDGQTGRVVGGAVDPVAARELLQRLRHVRVGHREVPVGVERSDVVVDAETHDLPPWSGSARSIRGPVQGSLSAWTGVS